jgi:hypothetical protein
MAAQAPPVVFPIQWEEMAANPVPKENISPAPTPFPIPPDGGVIDLKDGSGLYKGYMFRLSPEQLHNIRETVVDAIIREVSSLREQPK